MRNRDEQIAYIIKHRRSAMNDTDFENALWDLFTMGEEQGKQTETENQSFREYFND